MTSVLILGANSDVGNACAHHFANRGFNLLLAGRIEEKTQKQVETDLAIRYSVNVQSCYFDALDFKSHADFVKSLNPFPELVISVFGVLGDQGKAEEDFELAKRIIDTNFLGNVSILSLFSLQMKKERRGTLVCLSSVAAERGRRSNFIYGSSKAGLTAYLSGLRSSMFPYGVHVITVIPGFIKTKMIGDLKTPNALTATPQQVAEVVFNSVHRKKNVVYTVWPWRYVMGIIKLIPEGIFKKLNF